MANFDLFLSLGGTFNVNYSKTMGRVVLAIQKTSCVRRCCLDEKDVCMGCFRSLNEILHWHEFSKEEIEAALGRTEERRQEYFRLFPSAKLTSNSY